MLPALHSVGVFMFRVILLFVVVCFSGCSVQMAKKVEEPVVWQGATITSPFCVPEARELVALDAAGVGEVTPTSKAEAEQLWRYIRLSEKMYFETECQIQTSQVRSGNAQDFKKSGQFLRGLAAESAKDGPVPKEDTVAFRFYTQVVAYRSKEEAAAFVNTPKWNQFLERRRRLAAFSS